MVWLGGKSDETLKNNGLLINNETSTIPATVEDNDKTCRICLEDDHPQDMIAPCSCRGSSKWVHRECLDLWRTNEEDRAFSKCTECLFEYRMLPSTTQHHWRRAKYCMLISRDVVLLTLGVQALIIFLGWFVWIVDQGNTIVDVLDGGTCLVPTDGSGTDDTTTDVTAPGFWCNHTISVYYLCGVFVFLILLGFLGCTVLCQNQCSVGDSLSQLSHDPTMASSTNYYSDDLEQPHGVHPTHMNRNGPTNAGSTSYASPRVETYRRRRHRILHHRRRGTDCDVCCYDPYIGGRRIICLPPADGDCCYCGDGCCGSACEGSCPDSRCRGDDSNGAVHVLLVVLLVVAIVMAVIGFVVGIVIAVVTCQRIIQRHLFVLQKQRLVHEFQVMDLSKYSDDFTMQSTSMPVIPTAPPSDLDDPSVYIQATAPPGPTLQEEDAAHLRKLGLME